MKLLSMTDFVIENENMVKQTESEMSKDLYKLAQYAHFLKQPLELWMFVPCDEKGNVLKGKPLSPATDSEWIRWENEEFEFYKARDRVLFENFRFVESHKIGIDYNLDYFVFPYGKNRLGLTKKQEGFRTWFQLFTIEDLIQCNLELSKNAIEELQLSTI